MTVNEWLTESYDRIKLQLTKFEFNRGRLLDEDIFHDTLAKMLMKGEFADKSQQGYDNYCFMAYKINVIRDLQYPRKSKTTYVDDMTPYQSPKDDGDAWWIYDAIEKEFGESGLMRLTCIGDDEIINWLKKNV